MGKKIDFERFLFGEDSDNKFEIDDVEFWAEKMITFISLRPLKLEKAIFLCKDYCSDANFKQKLLEDSIYCPVLIYKLYKKGVYSFNEIEPIIMCEDSFILSHYFYKEIEDFESFIINKAIPSGIDESFLENAIDIDYLIEYGYLPSSIEYCLKYDDLEVFRDFSLTNMNDAKWSPFEWSCRPDYMDLLSFSGFFGSIRCFKHLLLNGFEINNEVTLSVVCSGSFDLFRLCSGDIFSTEYLCKASEFGHFSLITFLYENGTEINAKNYEDMTPLHCSTLYGILGVVEYLVNHGADINVKNSDLYTPLHYSSEFGHLSVIEYLINHGASINEMDSRGWTPLHFAAFNNYIRIVEYLVQHGANSNSKNQNGWTPLHFAADNGYLCVVEFLVMYGADVNAKEDSEWTPLHFAADNDFLSVVEYLVQHGADMNAKNCNNKTPLHCSCENGYLSVVEYLVNHGADLNIQNNNDDTPLHYSAEYGHLDVTKYLVNHGADIDPIDCDD